MSSLACDAKVPAGVEGRYPHVLSTSSILSSIVTLVQEQEWRCYRSQSPSGIETLIAYRILLLDSSHLVRSGKSFPLH